ncbi:hypothetical protein Vi05172_g12536 [Venturia inaequalis]|nr:hypothetical protein Vi05172_g12536 [Venturia inaequalis]
MPLVHGIRRGQTRPETSIHIELESPVWIRQGQASTNERGSKPTNTVVGLRTNNVRQKSVGRKYNISASAGRPKETAGPGSPDGDIFGHRNHSMVAVGQTCNAKNLSGTANDLEEQREALPTIED